MRKFVFIVFFNILIFVCLEMKSTMLVNASERNHYFKNSEWNYIIASPWEDVWTISKGKAYLEVNGIEIYIDLINASGEKVIRIEGEGDLNVIKNIKVTPYNRITGPRYSGFMSGYCAQSYEGVDAPCTETIIIKNSMSGKIIGLTRRSNPRIVGDNVESSPSDAKATEAEREFDSQP